MIYWYFEVNDFWINEFAFRVWIIVKYLNLYSVTFLQTFTITVRIIQIYIKSILDHHFWSKMNKMMLSLRKLVFDLSYPSKSKDHQSLPDTFRWRAQKIVYLMVVQRTFDFHLKQFQNDYKDYVRGKNSHWINSTKQREFLLNLFQDQKWNTVSQVMLGCQVNTLFEASLC